jgi:hypothetical protein
MMQLQHITQIPDGIHRNKARTVSNLGGGLILVDDGRLGDGGLNLLSLIDIHCVWCGVNERGATKKEEKNAKFSRKEVALDVQSTTDSRFRSFRNWIQNNVKSPNISPYEDRSHVREGRRASAFGRNKKKYFLLLQPKPQHLPCFHCLFVCSLSPHGLSSSMSDKKAVFKAPSLPAPARAKRRYGLVLPEKPPELQQQEGSKDDAATPEQANVPPTSEAQHDRQDTSDTPTNIFVAPDGTHIPLLYEPPFWSAPPIHKYFLEIMKDGVVVETLPTHAKGHYLVGRLPFCDIQLEHPVCIRIHRFVLNVLEETS